MIGKRLLQARLLARMTQQQVSEELSKLDVSLTKAGVSKYERGGSVPNASLLLRLAQVLGVKADYFLREETVIVKWLAFRRHVSLGKKEQDRIKAFAERVVEGQVWLQECLFPEEQPVFPRRSRAMSPEDAEKAAARLRQKWELGDCPLESVTETVEQKGGIVVDCPIAAGEFDGLSGWANRKYPIAVVSSAVPDDRCRFDLAHELGHLMMDCRQVDEKEEDRFAYRFAAAFIVPPAVARRELGDHRHKLDLQELALLKIKHGLSMQAWMRRAVDLNIIGQSTYRALCVEFSRRRWRRSEPVQFVGRERPMRLKQMTLRALAEGIITPDKAEQLCLGCTEEPTPTSTEQLAEEMSAVDIIKLPKPQREKILAKAAELLKEEYKKDPDLTEFEALGNGDFYE